MRDLSQRRPEHTVGREDVQRTGIFSRKSSWLKRKPRSVLEDGLGAELNRPEGRSTRIRCRLPGNEVCEEMKKSSMKCVSKSQNFNPSLASHL